MTYKVEICDMIQIYLRSIPKGWQPLKKVSALKDRQAQPLTEFDFEDSKFKLRLFLDIPSHLGV